ncbi:TonB-dependent receptor domain-containing protein [Peristeroidobacter soli]|uniref:TonB-dependent receptor domain-containing protein n=1 Tax=Peristeroidobacter soli TaxID=2497877 RepID=UPI00101D9A7E|nr:TonB-dependent receptor [Peristeroidobacter soli]
MMLKECCRSILLSCATLAVSITTHPSQAVAREQLQAFDIPAQELDSALRAFARASLQQVVFEDEAVKGKRSVAVKGEFTTRDALDRLLGGSGLRVRTGESGLLIVSAAVRTSATWVTQSGAPGGRSTNEAGAAASESEKHFAVEEIIVTATKRAERILDVPQSITAFTSDRMREQGSVQLADFLQAAPGVSIVDTQAGTQSIQIRGINSTFGDAPIGYYLDELPFSFISQPVVPDVRTFDLERVEVLRGPQGTLYGDGSLGGTIRVLTAEPNLSNLQSDVDLTIASTEHGEDSWAAKGMLNLPIVAGKAALRLVASQEDIGGWTDNIATGVADENERSIDTYRGKLRLAPNDRLDVILSFWRTDSEAAGSNGAYENQTTDLTPVSNDMAYDLYSLTVRYDLGFADLVSATSYMDFSLFNAGTLLGLPVLSDQTQEVRSEELRLTSSNDGGFRWTGGLFYRKIERPVTAQVLGLNFGEYAQSESYAVFGEGTWPLLDRKLDLTLGLRYFKDDRLRADPIDPATLALIQTIDPSFTGRVESSIDTLNPRLNLAWHVSDDWLLYTNVAKGFRAGQVQPTVSLISAALIGMDIPVGIEEEIVWSYELGAKGTFAAGRASVEAAVYYNDWRNLMLNVVVEPVTQLSALQNGAAARTIGAELSLSAQPIEGLNLQLSASHVEAEYTEADAGVNVRKGDRVTRVPENTLAASATYRWPLTATLDAFVFGQAQYTSDQVDLINNLAPSDDVTLLGTRLGAEGQSWGIYLFGDNLTDENAAMSVAGVVNGLALPTARPRPRTVGLNMSYRFR